MGALVSGIGSCVAAAGVLLLVMNQPVMGALVVLAGAVLVIAGLRS